MHPLGHRRRQQHTHRLGNRAPVAREQLQHLVQAGRIRSILRKYREAFHRQRRRTRRHPRAIPPHCIDLAVMPQLPCRLRAMPRRQRVRRITLMEDGKVRHELRVRKVRIEIGDMFSQAKRLVHNRPRRKRTHVTSHLTRLRRGFKLLARKIQPPLHRIRPNQIGCPHIAAMGRRIRDQHLPDHRHRIQRNLTQHFSPDRHIAPTKHAQVLRIQTAFDHTFSARLAGRQKHHAHTEFIFRIEINSGRNQQKFFRNTQQQPHTVTALAIGGHSAAMRQPRQRR